jgi:hypothetical protein
MIGLCKNHIRFRCAAAFKRGEGIFDTNIPMRYTNYLLPHKHERQSISMPIAGFTLSYCRLVN